MAETTPAHVHGRYDWKLWYGLFGGLTAWILQLAIGFAVVHDLCLSGEDGVLLWASIITAVPALLALGALIAAYSSWRAERTEGDTLETIHGVHRFMSITGMWFSGLSLLIILLLVAPIVWIYPCV